MSYMKPTKHNTPIFLLKNIPLSKYLAHMAFVSAIGLTSLFTSCSKNEEPAPIESPKSTSILIYAVASNNLSIDFANDMAEVCQAAASIDFSKVDVWVYSLTRKDPPKLTRLKKDSTSGSYVFETVKDYDRLTFSTDPKRISEVISDYMTLSESPQRASSSGAMQRDGHPTSRIISSLKVLTPEYPRINQSVRQPRLSMVTYPRIRKNGMDKISSKMRMAMIIMIIATSWSWIVLYLKEPSISYGSIVAICPR